MIKKVIIASLLLLVFHKGISQKDFIQVQTNKVLCLISFLETASHQHSTSRSFRRYIQEQLGEDVQFSEIVASYKELNINYSAERQEYPKSRHISFEAKELIWIAASNSISIADFNERIVGYLPHQKHVKLINALEQVSPYYEELIWKKEQKNIRKLQKKLIKYKGKIADLYLKISQFYGTEWDARVPFKIMLYPIPLERGSTTAIPKGNMLICSFLSHNEHEAIGILGIAIHEMCHILYGEQPASFQHQIDKWFAASKSPYAKLAYSYINEGLATALGNGWAYEQINGSIDTTAWYNNEHIDGFAHAIFPMVKEYVENGKTIDQGFVDKAIDLFAKTFPNATRETNILMNEFHLFANTEKEEELDLMMNSLFEYFNIRSMWMNTPIYDEKAKESFAKQQTTKLFIIDSKHQETLEILDQAFPNLAIKTTTNSMDILEDKESQSTIIILNIDDLAKIKNGLAILSKIKYIEYGKSFEID